MYRFVPCESTDDPDLVEYFRSDRDKGKRPSPRAKAYADLLDGMSMFGSLEAARERWRDLEALASSRGERVRVGYYVAEVILRPENGFAIEDLGQEDEHLTVWGAAEALCAAITRIYPASTKKD